MTAAAAGEWSLKHQKEVRWGERDQTVDRVSDLMALVCENVADFITSIHTVQSCNITYKRMSPCTYVCSSAREYLSERIGSTCSASPWPK